MGAKNDGLPWHVEDGLPYRDDQTWDAFVDTQDKMCKGEQRFGRMTSSHEALGVLVEEMDELKDAIRANALESIREEAIDVAAVAIRLAAHCRGNAAFAKRSGA